MSDPAPTRIAVVGIPGNRRVGLFQEALRRAGLPAARTVGWRDVVSGRADFAPGELVRCESPGEDAVLDRRWRAVPDPTRVEGTARWYERFTAATRALGARVTACGAELLDDPGELAVLFDKRRCHAVLREAGVPVPVSPTSGRLEPIAGWTGVRELLAAAGLRRAFVKLAHGSSASGVLAIQTSGSGRIQATTSVQLDDAGHLYNSLRVRQYRTDAEVGAIVDALAPDGLHVERWHPKASQHGRSADLRVVVVGGRATHAVVRTGTSPMTNLHLGGARGDLDLARAATESAGGRWPEVLELAERAAACFPGFSRVGVDVLPGVGWRRFVVGEVNAFGDLLPGLPALPGSGFDGDTYDAQVAAIARRPIGGEHAVHA
ncbi:STM4014 family protein [Nocardia spumae]|uniref:STM4014 family protein n=1 Tax=Nocardia spumae TaxID=2887190 RepID=UPI001D149076|nr:STM4014 family protein [Nocardia spumae]